MNSSISASDTSGWAVTLLVYAAATVLLGAAIAALLVMFDPYDTGRLAVVTGYGVPVVGQRLAAASLAREPNAAGAIIGNSTIQLVDPSRLTVLTGVRFASLAVAGSGPVEQLAVAQWYRRHHGGGAIGAQSRAIVFGLDVSWCQSDGRLDITNPFPFWLYNASLPAYVLNLMQLKTFEIAERKFKLVIGRDKPLRADGYRDYDSGHDFEAEAKDELGLPADNSALPSHIDFAAVPQLRDFLALLPATTAVVLLFPPRHLNGLPTPGSGAAALFERCKAAYRHLAAQRPLTTIVDLAVDGAVARNDQYFWDRIHYRQPVARIVEDSIAQALGRSAEAQGR